MRPGELCGLQREDVRFDEMVIRVCRSWDRPLPKDGDERVIPILPDLVPFLKDALRCSSSQLVFPRADGHMQPRNVHLHKILRRALSRAGIVDGYAHVCRKKGCKHRVEVLDADLRHCPIHGHKLWPKAKVRPIRMYDLRHATATLMLKAGVNPAIVAKLLGHSSLELVLSTYGHLDVEDVRQGTRRHGGQTWSCDARRCSQ
jgi:integrase